MVVELAVFLTERKRKVTLIEESNKLATEMSLPRRWRVLDEIRKAGVNILCETTVEAIGKKDITCVSKTGDKRTYDIDSVIIAKGARDNQDLADSIKAEGFEVHLIGDCGSVEYIKGAMKHSFDTARSI